MKFGAALARTLQDLNIAPGEFARQINMDRGNLSKLLNCKGREPALPTMQRILRALPDTVDVRALILGELDG